MKTILEHIDTVREKPHHIRRRVAFGAAAGISAVIAVVWLSASLATGAFAIKGSSFADSVGQPSVVVTTDAAGDTQGLAGAAAALEDKRASAHIEIVDTSAAAPAKSQAEKTVLPF